LFLGLAPGLLVGCGGSSDGYVVVEVKADGLISPISQLRVEGLITETAKTFTLLVPPAKQPLTFPTSFALDFGSTTSGHVRLKVIALDETGKPLAEGVRGTDFTPGATSRVEVALVAIGGG
jgi:hypothetical protein